TLLNQRLYMFQFCESSNKYFYLKRFQNLVKIGLLNVIHISYESPYNINMRLIALNKLISDYYTILCLSYTTYETYQIIATFLFSNHFLYFLLKTKLR